MRISTAKYFFALLSLVLLFGCEGRQKITTSSPDALREYDEGMKALNLFYYSDAIAAFQRALKTDSTFAMASARLAQAYANTENSNDAQKEIVRALRLSPAATKEEQLFIRSMDHRVHYRYAEAAEVTDSLIEISPSNAEAYTLRGNLYEVNKDFEAGLEMYRRAVQADTSYALAVMSLGYAYSSLGDFDKAIEQMERYIRLAPQAADSRASFADVLFRAGRYDEALEQYNESLKLKPDYWYAIGKIGEVYSVLGRLNEADKQFDLGLTNMALNDPTRATHLATEAALQYYRGKYDDAIRLCDQSLALDSTNFAAARVAVVSLLKLKKFDLARTFLDNIRLELVRRNLAESQAMVDYHLLRSRYYREQAMLDEAHTHCDSAMEFGTELSRSAVFQELAEIYLQAERYDDALDALEGALRYNENRPEALFTLAKVYSASGDKQMASSIGKRLLDLWKNADSDFQRRVELKRLLGRSLDRTAPIS